MSRSTRWSLVLVSCAAASHDARADDAPPDWIRRASAELLSARNVYDRAPASWPDRWPAVASLGTALADTTRTLRARRREVADVHALDELARLVVADARTQCEVVAANALTAAVSLCHPDGVRAFAEALDDKAGPPPAWMLLCAVDGAHCGAACAAVLDHAPALWNAAHGDPRLLDDVRKLLAACVREMTAPTLLDADPRSAQERIERSVAAALEAGHDRVARELAVGLARASSVPCRRVLREWFDTPRDAAPPALGEVLAALRDAKSGESFGLLLGELRRPSSFKAAFAALRASRTEQLRANARAILDALIDVLHGAPAEGFAARFGAPETFHRFLRSVVDANADLFEKAPPAPWPVGMTQAERRGTDAVDIDAWDAWWRDARRFATR